MKSKRWLVLIIAALAAFTWGCGLKEAKTGNTEKEQEETTWAELFCDVDWWHSPVWTTEKGTVTGDITSATGVALKTTIPQQDADRQLSLMLVNDELPDFISVTDPTVIGQLTSSGKVWKLDEFFKKYCPDSHLLTKFPKDMKKALIRRDGAWYSLPSHINTEEARKIWKPCDAYYEDLTNYSENNGIIWNRNLLGQLGISIDDLKTEEQVMAAWEKAVNSKITVDGQKIVPLLIDGSTYWDTTLKYLQNTFGAEHIDENGNYKDILLQSESRHALSFLNQAYYKRYFPAEQMNYINDEVKEKLAGGNVLCFIGNIANTEINASEWVSSGAILSSEGKTPVLGKNLHENTGWLQTFISKDCQDPEKIAEFLDYMTSDEGMMKWEFGYEGKDYSINKDGQVCLTAEQNRRRDDYSQNGLSAWWMFSNTAWNRSVVAPPDPDSKTAQMEVIRCAFGKESQTVIYDTSVFGTFTDLVQDKDLSDLDTQITALKKKWISRVVLSGSDAEFQSTYEEMCKELQTYGIDKVDEEKNHTFQENEKEMGIDLEKINK